MEPDSFTQMKSPDRSILIAVPIMRDNGKILIVGIIVYHQPVKYLLDHMRLKTVVAFGGIQRFNQSVHGKPQ